MPSFNLVDEPWIPCLMLPDRVPRELSLRETLLRAHDVAEVADPSPLVTVALHRLLLAILHRNFGPENLDAWAGLWNRGAWDAAVLGPYLDRWRHRFDLFDPERPFYQVPLLEDSKEHPVSLLVFERASGNNLTLFDHNSDSNPNAMSPAQAARGLLARQAYSIGFGKSTPFYFADAPLVRGLALLVVGTSLFETLALNLVEYNAERPFPSQSRDLPCWEQEVMSVPDPHGTLPQGYVDYLTWLSRRIRLIPEGEPPVVRRVQVLQNLKLPEAVATARSDPFKAYRRDEKRGQVPLGLRPDRSVWRDSHALLQDLATQERESHRPAVLQRTGDVGQLRDLGRIEAQERYQVAVLGMATDPGKAASIVLWRHERLPLPLDYLNRPELAEDLGLSVSLAEQAGGRLRGAVRHLARLLLAPESDAGGGRKPDEKKAVTPLAESLGAVTPYWSALERPFKQFMVELAAADEGRRDRLLRVWAVTLRAAAWDAFEGSARAAEQSPRGFKAAAMARSHLARGLGSALKGYLPEKDGAPLGTSPDDGREEDTA